MGYVRRAPPAVFAFFAKRWSSELELTNDLPGTNGDVCEATLGLYFSVLQAPALGSG